MADQIRTQAFAARHWSYGADFEAAEIEPGAIGVLTFEFNAEGQARMYDAKSPERGAVQGTWTQIGTYVEIPRKFYSPDDSGLSCTVKKGSQTYPIELK